MGIDRDGSVRPRKAADGWHARYKLAGHWTRVEDAGGAPAVYATSGKAKAAAIEAYRRLTGRQVAA